MDVSEVYYRRGTLSLASHLHKASSLNFKYDQQMRLHTENYRKTLTGPKVGDVYHTSLKLCPFFVHNAYSTPLIKVSINFAIIL